MTDEELTALVERLEAEGEYTGQPHELACKAAASAIRQLMIERDEAMARVEVLEDAWRYDRHRD